MKYNVDVTDILKTFVNKLPENQIGVVSCYLGTIGAGLIAYKLKLDHDYKMSTLNAV